VSCIVDSGIADDDQAQNVIPFFGTCGITFGPVTFKEDAIVKFQLIAAVQDVPNIAQHYLNWIRLNRHALRDCHSFYRQRQDAGRITTDTVDVQWQYTDEVEAFGFMIIEERRRVWSPHTYNTIDVCYIDVV
jgi:hypothetical protein